MYASYFGLRELPFNNTPDPRFFFSTPDHEEALASLIYAVEEAKGFVLLTGEVGSGKTLVTRLMLRHFAERIAFAGISNTQMTAHDLLQSVCTEFGVEAPAGASNAELVRCLQDFLLHSFAANRPVVLMLDEAQALSREAFEQIRMIGNLEADDAKLLQIVIVGQPELRARFEAEDMRQLRQRIFRGFHLSALTRAQSEGYIRHRLGVAGAPYPERIFDEAAVDLIHQHAQGLPRVINTVCDNAMISAYAADRQAIDREFIEHVIAQMTSVGQVAGRAGLPDVQPGGAAEAGLGADGAPPEVGAAPPADASPGIGERLQLDVARSVERIRREYVARFADEVEHLREQAVAREGHRDQPPVDLTQFQVLTRQFRRLIEEARETARDLREVVAAARSAKVATEQDVARLAEHSAGAGRLCVVLRGVVDKLESRADALDRRAATLGASREKPVAPDGKRVLESARRIDRTIGDVRNSMDEVRSVIAALHATHPAAKRGPSTDHPADAAGAKTLRLAEQVRELAAVVHEGRALRIASA